MPPIVFVALVAAATCAGVGVWALSRRSFTVPVTKGGSGKPVQQSATGTAAQQETMSTAQQEMRAPTAQREEQPTGERVAVIGNSIGAARGGFVSQITPTLRSNGATVDNFSVSGYTTGRMLTVARRELRPGRFVVVLVEGHLNDRSWPASRTIENLREIYRLARASGARVVAIGSTPWAGYRNWNRCAQARQSEVERWLANGADGLIHGFIPIYAALEDPARPGYLRQDFDGGDHLHPNRAGQRVIATAVTRGPF